MQENDIEIRRRLLKTLGGAAVVVSVTGIAGCSGGEEPPSSTPATGGQPATAPERTPAADPQPSDEPAAQPQADQAAGTELERLSENDPQAKALSYVHDASKIDSAAQPRYEEGQVCANCALYTGKSGEEWGGCSLFPGKAVNAAGWCSAYVPKPS